MSDTVIDRLSAPFPVEKVKQRPGVGGRMLDYIAGEDILQRYLDELGIKWSWSSKAKITDTAVFVTGTLDIILDAEKFDYTHRTGMGACTLLNKDPDEAIKTANTEAFKNAAKHFGTGLYLWREEERALIEEQRNEDKTSLATLKAQVRALAREQLEDNTRLTAQTIASWAGVEVSELSNVEVLKTILITKADND
jgi:hypothetical protein